MNEFIYNGSHLGTDDNDCLMELANGVSVWVVYERRKQKYQVKHKDDLLLEVDTFTKVQLFIEGMKVFGKNAKAFDKIERVDYPSDLISLQKELERSQAELIRTKKLAKNLIKGIVKNDKETLGKELSDRLEKLMAEKDSLLKVN